MEKSPIQNWFIELQRIWLENDVQALDGLMSDSFEYYEDPFQRPLTNLIDLKDVWKEVTEQKIQQLNIKVLIDNVRTGMAHYEFLYIDTHNTSHMYSGSYYVELDFKGRAVMFRQWWVEKS